ALAKPDQLVGETLEFDRSRVDGSSIDTVASNVPTIWPNTSGDSVLRTRGCPNPEKLWRLHRWRVLDDERAGVNRPVTDAIDFQRRNEALGAERRIASGYWQLC